MIILFNQEAGRESDATEFIPGPLTSTEHKAQRVELREADSRTGRTGRTGRRRAPLRAVGLGALQSAEVAAL